MDENEAGSGGLDAETAAYFESRGEKLPADTGSPSEANNAARDTMADKAAGKPADSDPADAAARAAVEGGKEPTTVPIRALHEEREEKRALRAEREEMSRKLAVLEDRWATLLSMQQQEQPKADEDPEPDPQKDIFAHNAWLKRQLDKVSGSVTERQKQEEAAAKAAEGERLVWAHWHQDAAAFKAKDAEFGDVVKWGSEYRSKQLEAMSGLYPQFATEAGRTAQINAELADIVVKAAQAGKSPAEVVNGLVRSWGYTKAPPPAADPAKIIEQANKGKDAEISLSAMGGSANKTGPKTADDIQNMSADEYEAWLTGALKDGAKGFRRIMGG